MSTNQQTINWYNENADDYTAHVRNPDDSVYHHYYEKPAMYGLLPDLKGKSVLSLGCGSGEDSAYLKSQGAEKSVGVDISSGLIEIAKRDHPGCEFQIMNMEQLEFPNESFDFAYSSLAIHYLEDWKKVFKEVLRVLKPNSYFLFSCGHPVRYAMGSCDTDTEYVSKLEIAKNKITKEYRITGDYIARKKISGGLGADTVTTWRKSYAEIAAELHDTGFLIEQIVDPVPTEEMKVKFPGKYDKLMKIPEFTIFRLLKVK